MWLQGGEAWAERIAIGRFGTWSEVVALARALDQHSGISSVVVVSSWYHILRLRICCHALLPKPLRIRFVSSRDGNEKGKAHQITSICGEFLKIPLYFVLSVFQGLNSK